MGTKPVHVCLVLLAQTVGLIFSKGLWRVLCEQVPDFSLHMNLFGFVDLPWNLRGKNSWRVAWWSSYWWPFTYALGVLRRFLYFIERYLVTSCDTILCRPACLCPDGSEPPDAQRRVQSVGVGSIHWSAITLDEVCAGLNPHNCRQCKIG